MSGRIPGNNESDLHRLPARVLQHSNRNIFSGHFCFVCVREERKMMVVRVCVFVLVIFCSFVCE